MEWNEYDVYKTIPITWGWCEAHGDHIYMASFPSFDPHARREVCFHDRNMVYQLIDDVDNPSLLDIWRAKRFYKRLIKEAIKSRDHKFTEDE